MSGLEQSGLWNIDVKPDAYGEKYRDHVLDQYKLYVEMADRISTRRDAANRYFLTLHSSLIAAAGFLYEKGHLTANWGLLVVAWLFAETLCWAWWRIVLSYRQLNGAKYKVIGLFEKGLPVSPYGRAEWKMLGEGKDPTRYRPVTHVEQWVPVIFGALYFLAVVVLAITNRS